MKKIKEDSNDLTREEKIKILVNGYCDHNKITNLDVRSILPLYYYFFNSKSKMPEDFF